LRLSGIFSLLSHAAQVMSIGMAAPPGFEERLVGDTQRSAAPLPDRPRCEASLPRHPRKITLPRPQVHPRRVFFGLSSGRASFAVKSPSGKLSGVATLRIKVCGITREADARRAAAL